MRFLTLLSLFFLSACGFTPLYGESPQNTGTATGLNQVEISIIPDREGQFLRNALMDRFYKNGIPSNALYELKVEPITEKVSDFDITIESEATRRQLKLNSTMTLIDKKTNETVLSRPLVAITSHNVLESEFSTIVTEQSAREAALNDLARQVERQLTLYFAK